jgi:hypothetical protein
MGFRARNPETEMPGLFCKRENRRKSRHFTPARLLPASFIYLPDN